MRKIYKLLIANRGEVVCRIIRTARNMGIKTVAVYSEADANQMYVKLADEAIYIGESSPTSSYLNIEKILQAVFLSGADAVHPGHGFLSENYRFAAALNEMGITFVGPSVESIKKMGDKVEAKKIAKELGVSTTFGYDENIKTLEESLKIANRIGYPVILKAASGGGGRGMRIVHTQDDMEYCFDSAKSEAMSSYGNDRVFMEQYIQHPRHIEIQVLGDKYGSYVCLGDRECSIQRYHQKVVEEAPSSFIDESTRYEMYRQSVMLAKSVGYFSAGTIEYIVDQNRNFYFMEMNTRLQVEHPVTELITGIDIVEQMIRIAEGEKLSITQDDVVLNGYALECRIYAETADFFPSTGTVAIYKEPQKFDGVRIDSGICEGSVVSMFYDSMISKVCTHFTTRLGAIDKMQHVLGEYVITGISTNIIFLQKILSDRKMREGDISTSFLDDEFKKRESVIDEWKRNVFIASTVVVFLTTFKRSIDVGDKNRPSKDLLKTRWVVVLGDNKYNIVVRSRDIGYMIKLDDEDIYVVSNWNLGDPLLRCIVNNKQCNLQVDKHNKGAVLTFMDSSVICNMLTPRISELQKFMPKGGSVKVLDPCVKSMISGIITNIAVKLGDSILKGQTLMSITAMKMENYVTAHMDGTVLKIFVEKGDIVNSGAVLVEIESSDKVIKA